MFKTVLFFSLSSVVLSWHKCTEVRVDQYLCNYTAKFEITQSDCIFQGPACNYDSIQGICICGMMGVCTADDPANDAYKILNLSYTITFNINKNDQVYFLASNLTYTGQTFWNNSTLIPTGIHVDYASVCDGRIGDDPWAISQNFLFDKPTNLSIDYDCNYNAMLFYQVSGAPVYDLTAGIVEGVGIYAYDYIDEDGSFLTPERNFSSFALLGNLTCLSFDSTPDPSPFAGINSI